MTGPSNKSRGMGILPMSRWIVTHGQDAHATERFLGRMGAARSTGEFLSAHLQLCLFAVIRAIRGQLLDLA